MIQDDDDNDNAMIMMMMIRMIKTQNNSANFEAKTSRFSMVIDINDTYSLYFHAKSYVYFENKLVHTYLENLFRKKVAKSCKNRKKIKKMFKNIRNAKNLNFENLNIIENFLDNPDPPF